MSRIASHPAAFTTAATALARRRDAGANSLAEAGAGRLPEMLLLLLAFFGLGFAAFGRCLVFGFLFALLDDFGLGRNGSFHGRFGGLFFLLTESDDVSEHAIGRGNQLHFFRVDGQIARAQLHANHQVADIDLEFRRNLRWQALDFDFAGDGLENATLLLDAGGFTDGVHGNLDAHAYVHGHTQQINVQQAARQRIDLPVLEDGGLVLAAELDLEKSVVPGGRTQNRAHLLGVDGQGDRRAFAAVEHRRYLAGHAQAAGFVFAALGARSALHHDFLLSHRSFLPCSRRAKARATWFR